MLLAFNYQRICLYMDQSSSKTFMSLITNVTSGVWLGKSPEWDRTVKGDKYRPNSINCLCDGDNSHEKLPQELKNPLGKYHRFHASAIAKLKT